MAAHTMPNNSFVGSLVEANQELTLFITLPPEMAILVQTSSENLPRTTTQKTEARGNAARPGARLFSSRKYINASKI
jgi:hypothetical protein